MLPVGLVEPTLSVARKFLEEMCISLQIPVADVRESQVSKV